MNLPKEYTDSRDLNTTILLKARRAIDQGLYGEAAAWYQELDKRLTDGEALPQDWQSVKANSGQRF